MYKVFYFKRYVEQILMFPFVLLGRIAASFCAKTNYDIFFFIPIYGVGGAEYVNGKILLPLKNKKIALIFTKKSYDVTAKHLFEQPNITVSDISKWTDNKFLYFANFYYRGYYAQLIKRNRKKPDIFIGQCNFGYKLTPHLHRNYRVVELIHFFEKKFCYVWMPFVNFLDVRLCVSQEEINKFEQYYNDAGIDKVLFNRFILLPLYVEINSTIYKHNSGNHLKVYYAGRGTSQKRLWLNFEIARQAKLLNLPLSFDYVGNFKDELPSDFCDYATYYKPIESGKKMHEFIAKRDILLMTSASEGLPIALLEAAKLGIVPIVTPVGEMKNLIQTNTNGVLLNNNSEDSVVSSAVDALKSISTNPILYHKMSTNVTSTFNAKFSKEKFDQTILSVFSK